jgi:hypothetical protein
MVFRDLDWIPWYRFEDHVVKMNPDKTIIAGKSIGKYKAIRWGKYPMDVQKSKLTISTGGVLMIGTHCIGIFSSGNEMIKIIYEPQEPKIIHLTNAMSKTLDNIRRRRMSGKYDRERLDEVHDFLIGSCGMRGIQLPK